ncbi:hypothetical protein R5R35_002183 [Gryllus longicercus]|uniref:Uncharacterized protein n=1 Tax=Gryllus longicercus TaxID=2509291 RepID=A0AAN9VSU1_9ORTH
MLLPFSSRQEDNAMQAVQMNVNTDCIQISNSAVFIYTSKRTTDSWEALIKKMEATTIRVNMRQLPKGIFFEITDIHLTVSEAYKKSSYVATLHNTFDVFLPTRFTSEIEAIGKEEFLAERPHLTFLGIHPKNKASVVLIYKYKDLLKQTSWENLLIWFKQYGLLEKKEIMYNLINKSK